MKRKLIGKPVNYGGYVITAHPLAPDVLIRKNNQDFGLYLTAEAGRIAAMKSIDKENDDKKANKL